MMFLWPLTQERTPKNWFYQHEWFLSVHQQTTSLLFSLQPLCWQIGEVQTSWGWRLWPIQPLQWKYFLTKQSPSSYRETGWSFENLLPRPHHHSWVLIIKSCFYLKTIFGLLNNLCSSTICCTVFVFLRKLCDDQQPRTYPLKVTLFYMIWKTDTGILLARLYQIHWLLLLDSASTNKLLGFTLYFFDLFPLISLSWFHSLLMEATLAQRIRECLWHTFSMQSKLRFTEEV